MSKDFFDDVIGSVLRDTGRQRRRQQTQSQFDRPIAEVSREELVAVFGNVLRWDDTGAATRGFADVTREIALNELQYPSDEPPRTLRNIWYASVKPVFSKLGMLRKPRTTKSSEQAFLKARTDKLSIYIANFVRDGLFTYADLGIRDTSRSRSPALWYPRPGLEMNYYVSFGIYPGLVLATEKDTQYGELERIAELYGCSVISGSGQNSFAACEALCSEIPDDVEEIRFLAFTDYDGAGYEIAETFEEQMRACVRNRGAGVDVLTERIGLNPEQLTADEIEANKYEMPNNEINRKWYEETGGVNGEFYGLELDSLKRQQRIRLVTDALAEHIDTDEYAELLATNHARRVAIQSLKGLADAAVDAVAGDTDIEPPDVTGEMLQDLALRGIGSVAIACTTDHDDEIASSTRLWLATRLQAGDVE